MLLLLSVIHVIQIPTEIELLNIGEQALTSNCTKLATIPIQDTVVIKKKINQEPQDMILLRGKYKDLKQKYDESFSELQGAETSKQKEKTLPEPNEFPTSQLQVQKYPAYIPFY